MSKSYFTNSEFACKCGRDNCDALTQPNQDLVAKLNGMRETLGRSIVINSGLRCKSYNAKVGGVSDSQHVLGEAADLKVPGSRDRFKLVEAAYQAGFRRIGVGKTFVHVDVGEHADQEVLWLY